MLDYLFVSGTTHGKLLIRNIRIKAKLMLVLCTQNVIPRRGDKFEVRFAEVLVLYMLMHGSQLIPFRFLVLNSIWIGRNSVWSNRCGRQRVVQEFKPFDIKHLGPGWEYKESEWYHKLKSDGKRWKTLKADARPLRPGEADEPESSDGESGYIGSAFDYARQPYDPYWAHSGNMEQVVEHRPLLTFTDWYEPNQMLFDQQTYMGASVERALKQSYD
ncbi:hypothetical protein Hanom_Chr05g00400851 [Helianthus anomalus]